MSSVKNQNNDQFDNKTLTLVTTALVASSNLIPDATLKKIAAASSPILTIVLAYIFKKSKNFIYMSAEQKRAISVYTTIIKDLEAKIGLCKNKAEKSKLKTELDKHEQDLRDLRIKNIKVFI